MFELKSHAYANKREHYEDLAQQARGLLAGERDLIANALGVLGVSIKRIVVTRLADQVFYARLYD